VLREHFPAVGIVLDLPCDLKTLAAFQPEVEATYAAEQGADRQRLLRAVFLCFLPTTIRLPVRRASFFAAA